MVAPGPRLGSSVERTGIVEKSFSCSLSMASISSPESPSVLQTNYWSPSPRNLTSASQEMECDPDAKVHPGSDLKDVLEADSVENNF